MPVLDTRLIRSYRRNHSARLAITLVVLVLASLLSPSVASAQDDGEIPLNVSGEPFRGTEPDGVVRGMLDAHSHMMIDLIAGGNVACGRPWSPQGPATALRDCPTHEQSNGVGAVNFNVTQSVVSGIPTVTHSAQGWPNFDYWPAWNVILHEQIYYRWLERAWRAGLRLYVMDATDNAAQCELNTEKTTSCDETEGVLRQIQATYALQDYIDTRSGGPGKGWFRIVTDPAQARRVINDGKLAVVLGIESSELFGCGERNGVPGCDRAAIDRGLDRIQQLGVTSAFIAHKFDNALAGVAMDKDVAGAVVNSQQQARYGHFWDVETCTGPAHDETQLTAPISLPTADLPLYPPAPHCNKRGLTELGQYFVHAMIRRQMTIEVDHLSVLARQQVLDIVEAEHYSGVISSHSWTDPQAQQRILRLGGMISPMAGPASTPDSDSAYPAATCCYLETWQRLRTEAGVGDAVLPIGFTDDMSGPSPQPTPRTPDMPEVHYPFRSFDGGTVIDRQQSGNRTFDINTDGVAHFGLFPDWWERLRLTAGQGIIDDLAAGAEGYLRMWERSTNTR